MKKIILTLVLMTSFCVVRASDPVYFNKMKETIEEMKKCTTAADYINVANTFERIAKKEPEEWLPLYYLADIQTLLVYVDTLATPQEKDHYLDEAEATIEKLEKLAPEEAEVKVIKAFMIISRLGLDPTSRGATLYPAYEAAIAEANALDPANPRVRYMVLSNDVGKAQWMGQSIEPYCPKMHELNEQWDAYPVVSAIHPSWGKEQLSQLMQSCP